MKPVWTAKPWGYQRPLFLCPTVEVWEGIGLPGLQTSIHSHPHHDQILVVTSGLGSCALTDEEYGYIEELSPTYERSCGHEYRHRIMFKELTHFIEMYTSVEGIGAPGSVSATKIVYEQWEEAIGENFFLKLEDEMSELGAIKDEWAHKLEERQRQLDSLRGSP